MRHGQTPYNEEADRNIPRIQGNSIGLSEIGERQVQAGARRLCSFVERGVIESPEHIHVSPLPRAIQSADIVANVLRDRLGIEVDISTQSELAEQSLPDVLDGRFWNDEDEQIQAVVRAIRGRTFDHEFSYEGYETMPQVRARVASYLSRFLNKELERTLIISHGGTLGVLRAILQEGDNLLINEKSLSPYVHRMRNAEVQVLQRAGNTWERVLIGRPRVRAHKLVAAPEPK